MAVVQISRIQIRRGQKNQGVGLPQLASGELGWAIDTQELFIGNGSVSEGAPAVGNTKILTTHDNIFSLVDTYSYLEDDPYLQTGSSEVTPIRRRLQDRLDDRVSVRAFGIIGEQSQNATDLLQNAIDQLYIKAGRKGSEQSRVILHIEPGLYVIDGPIYIPPFVNLVGAGQEKTVIRQVGNHPIFKTVNELSEPGTPADDSTSQVNNQARSIYISNMTLQHQGVGAGIILQSCRDSLFENLDIIGTWQPGEAIPADYNDSLGVQLNSLSGAVSSNSNKFLNCKIMNWGFDVISNWDINYNIFDKCIFKDSGQGFLFGSDMLLGSPGQEIGPRNTIISNSHFENINLEGMSVVTGYNNISQNNKYVLVGNEAGSDGQPVTNIINFSKFGNQSINDYFSRTEYLSYDLHGTGYIDTTPYIAEIGGIVSSSSVFTYTLDIAPAASPGTKIFRLPADASQSFVVDYYIISLTDDVQQNGKLFVSCQLDGGTPSLTVSEEYNFAGTDYLEDTIQFNAVLVDYNTDTTYDTIDVRAINTSGGTVRINFKVSNSKQSRT